MQECADLARQLGEAVWQRAAISGAPLRQGGDASRAPASARHSARVNSSMRERRCSRTSVHQRASYGRRHGIEPGPSWSHSCVSDTQEIAVAKRDRETDLARRAAVGGRVRPSGFIVDGLAQVR